ncbi:zinc-dependent peptidase [Azonexus fungiphilus]|uniref:M90 family metallopeptidase n=1 Tax=Azonexus fungiphilus TaxID=146940 RepID=UPI00156A9932|nr:M90 family metallopeptidase [Azonexus fungiphilus]NHC05434.1 zinc-dependent peptidase [Azonexus fungiphilus]
MGLFDWWRRRPAPIPEALWQRTLASLPFFATLTVDQQKRLKTLTERFLAEKEFTAAGGLELNDEICVAIAAQGCLPILELGLGAYGDWVGIVVYPDEFVVQREIADADGVVHEFADVLAGEAWEGGPLLVSWRDVQMAGGDYNVVIHEFAHKLDMLNGEVDGIPALHSTLTVDRWESVFFAAYDDFCARVDSGEETIIDPYASEAPEEFFAVLSECFFGIPDVVDAEYPALYALLREYFRQDPLARLRAK